MIFKKKESTQELLGIEAITDYGISTKQGELVFFSVAPTNLSVLPADSIDARINALLNIIKGYDGIEMIATDSMQSFEYNKRFYRDRLEKENCPAVRRLLEQDIEHLDRIQVMTASSRQFYIVLRIRSEVKGDIYAHLGNVEKYIHEQGFTVHRADRQELKKLFTTGRASALIRTRTMTVSSGNEEVSLHGKTSEAEICAYENREEEKRHAQAACEACPTAQNVLRYDRAGSYEVQPRRVYPR